MHLTSLSPEQSRILDDVFEIERLHRSLLQREDGLDGGYQWKRVGGEEYLTRFWTDPVTKRKQARSRGRRSPSTEAEYDAFYAARERVAADRQSLSPRMRDVARAARAFRLVRASGPIADVFRAFEQVGIWQTCMLLGGWASHAHANEARVRLDASPGDVDLLVPDGLVPDVMPSIGAALRDACPDASWHAEDTTIVGPGGLRIHIHDAADLLETFIASRPEIDALRSVTVALDAAPRPGLVVGHDGAPAAVATLDPTAHAVLKAARAVALGSDDARDAALLAIELARLIEPRPSVEASTISALDFDNHDQNRLLGRAWS